MPFKNDFKDSFARKIYTVGISIISIVMVCPFFTLALVMIFNWRTSVLIWAICGTVICIILGIVFVAMSKIIETTERDLRNSAEILLHIKEKESKEVDSASENKSDEKES